MMASQASRLDLIDWNNWICKVRERSEASKMAEEETGSDEDFSINVHLTLIIPLTQTGAYGF